MEQSLVSALDWMDGTLELIRQLGGAIEKAQAAVVASDYAGLELHTRRQQDICAAILVMQDHLPQNLNSKEANSLYSRLRSSATQLLQRNRMHAALLRRGRRTIDIFCRLLAGSTVAYNPPRTPAEWSGASSR